MKAFLVAFVLSASVFAFARTSAAVALPSVAHDDWETTTNVPFHAWEDRLDKFNILLSCLATPSNNVQAAFGVDADGDGVLSLGETAFVVGWDAGAWFVQNGCAGTRVEASDSSSAAVRSLVWTLRVGSSSGVPYALDARVDGVPVFTDLAAAPPRWFHSAEWNLVRLTGRGLFVHGEAFAVETHPGAFSVILR